VARRLPTLCLIAMALLTASGLSPSVAQTAVKPWEKEPDTECEWWLSGDDGHSLRAAIGMGDQAIGLSFGDKAFVAWSEEGRHRVQVRLNGDPKRQFEAEGWSTHVSAERAIFSLDLDAKGRRMLGGATHLELLRDGQSILQMLLANTPGRRELDRCVPRRSKTSDSE
jgi:hypothetical protein